MIKLGNRARELGDKTRHVGKFENESETKTEFENESETKTEDERPLGRTERADRDVQFRNPLRNMTLSPGSSVMINCDTIRARTVQLDFRPRNEDFEYLATINHSPTNASLLIVQVRCYDFTFVKALKVKLCSSASFNSLPIGCARGNNLQGNKTHRFIKHT